MNNTEESNKISALSISKKIAFHLDSKGKKEIKVVLFLSILSSLAESISVAMLIPFVSFFVNPENYIFNDLFENIFLFFNITNQKNVLAIVSFSFIFIVLVGGFIKLNG